jgi:hypothetical protein
MVGIHGRGDGASSVEQLFYAALRCVAGCLSSEDEAAVEIVLSSVGAGG